MAGWRDDKLAAGQTAVLALLACWLNKEGPNGDGARCRVSGRADTGACLSLDGTTTSRACWVNKESATRLMGVLAHWRNVESAAGLTAVLACWCDFELMLGLTAVLAHWRDVKSAAELTAMLARCSLAQRRVGGGADGGVRSARLLARRS